MKRLYWVRAVVVNNGNERSEQTLGALEANILGAVLLAVARVEIHKGTLVPLTGS